MADDSDLYENVGHTAYGFFKSFLKEKKDSLKNFLVKNKVGFLPIGLDYSVFQKISTKASFKQLKFLIGKHRTLPIVMTGLWINSLSEEEQLKVVDDNRNDVYQKYGEEGVIILNMGTTGFMESFIKFLSNYNIRKDISQKELIDIYELHIKSWAQITIFVKKDSTVNHIVQKCKSKINQDLKFIYMFASYGARKIALDSIKKLEKDGTLKEENYEVFMEKLCSQGLRQVWIFEKQESTK